MNRARQWWQGFAVQGIQWRRFVDWAVLNVPTCFHPLLIWIGTFFFFFIATPARRALVRNLGVVLPNSRPLANYLRTFRVFANFGWMLTDAAVQRLRHRAFTFEFEGECFLDELAKVGGAIILTAHMGNYDLGAALFAERFKRPIRIVRAPEPDAITAQHVDLAFHQSGNVKVDYSDHGTTLVFDLLNALRGGEIISVQGDRVVGDLSRSPIGFFGRKVLFPTGPFVLSLTSETPIYPLFVLRVGYRKYKVTACPPIIYSHTDRPRDERVAEAMAQWSQVLEKVVKSNWPQWYAFIALF